MKEFVIDIILIIIIAVFLAYVYSYLLPRFPPQSAFRYSSFGNTTDKIANTNKTQIYADMVETCPTTLCILAIRSFLVLVLFLKI